MIGAGCIWARVSGVQAVIVVNYIFTNAISPHRLALELQLDKPSERLDERTRSNYVRTWINAFCVDGSHAIQFGKPTMVESSDYLIRKVARFWHKSPNGSPYDIGLCAYAETLLLMMQFRKACKPEAYSNVGTEVVY